MGSSSQHGGVAAQRPQAQARWCCTQAVLHSIHKQCCTSSVAQASVAHKQLHKPASCPVANHQRHKHKYKTADQLISPKPAQKRQLRCVNQTLACQHIYMFQHLYIIRISVQYNQRACCFNQWHMCNFAFSLKQL